MFAFRRSHRIYHLFQIIIPFKIYLQSFPIQKLFIFVNENENGFSFYKCRKSLSKTTF